MAMQFLDIRDAAVQDFLWRHVEPADIRHDYTRIDAIKHVHAGVYAGEQWLIGDMAAGLMFRCVMRNPKVIEPHIMGNPARLRSLLPGALRLGWERGIERVCIWTQHAAIARIVVRLGFTHEATLRRAHLVEGKLIDLHVLTLERPV